MRLSIKFFVFTSVIILSSCQSSSKKESGIELADVPKGYKPKIKQLTFAGENRQASWAPDLKSIIFISSRFGQHINRQIYELDLENSKERRITHQIGDTAFPLYWPDKKKIVYSSTTDEIKEKFLESNLQESFYQPYEIYMSSVSGTDIERLTKRPGFDGHLSLKKEGSRITFSSWKDDDQQIIVMNAANLSQNRISKMKGHHRYPSYSRDGNKIIWIYQKDQNAPYWLVQFHSGHGNEVLVQIKANELKDISYGAQDNLVIFSSDLEEPGNLEIYSLDLSTKCLKRLTYSEEEDSYPRLSWDDQWILFQSRRSGIFQIYKMEHKTLDSCLELKDPSILTTNFDNLNKK